MDKKIITVFGSARIQPHGELHQIAYELGRMIAELGFTLCNGGYGGTMEASAWGAVDAGGHTIGVTCSLFGRSGPNPHIRQEIPTFDLLQRLNTLIRLGRAYVVLPGGTGTLTELALVWEMVNKKLLSGQRPLTVLGDDWQPVIECISRSQTDANFPVRARDVSAVREILAKLDV